jgi:protease PrsW
MNRRSELIKHILTAILLFGFCSLADRNNFPNPTNQPDIALIEGMETTDVDRELAQRFAPVVYFHPDEIYLPQPVEVTLSQSRLRQDVKSWFDTNVKNYPTPQDLFSIPTDKTYFLDQWFGDEGTSSSTNYTSHQAVYESSLSPQIGGLAPAVYAHVMRGEDPNHLTIQYWFFYFYDDWFNKHEGDWEMIELILSSTGQPEWAVYSQHHGGTRRSWAATPKEEGTHPAVFVARGSHANYFMGDEVYPSGQDVGNRRIEIVDRTGTSRRLIPKVLMLPGRAELSAYPGAWPDALWIMFQGRWGETGVQSDFSGPYGPADKGPQWEQPIAWGMSQPLDVETWYKNRLRVEIARPEQGQDTIWLTDESGQVLSQSESEGSLAILHTDPPDKVIARVKGTPGTRWGMSIYWPEPESSQVVQMRFISLELDASGQAQLELSEQKSAGAPVVPERSTSSVMVASVSAANRLTLHPSAAQTYLATWNVPDLVWMGGILPAPEIMEGILLALLFSLAPTLVFIAVLVWVNRYRREPVRMLAAAILWGAIPAVMVALTMELFFRLPSTLLASHTLESIRLNVVAPVLEELMKAAGVMIIYRRCRSEIKDVLDGMIFGGVVGFGFSFSTNFLRYAGDFLALGFSSLNSDLIVEHTVHALDHGLYTAIFGGGLGFAMMASTARRFKTGVVLALGLAIATHSLHNMLADSLVGLNALTVIVTGAGTLLLWIVAGWSMVAQRRMMRKELEGLVSDALFVTVLDPFVRARAQWNTLRWHGFRAWRKVRRLQGLCIKLANARLEMSLFPEKYNWSMRTNFLQTEIKRIYDGIDQLAR